MFTAGYAFAVHNYFCLSLAKYVTSVVFYSIYTYHVVGVKYFLPLHIKICNLCRLSTVFIHTTL